MSWPYIYLLLGTPMLVLLVFLGNITENIARKILANSRQRALVKYITLLRILCWLGSPIVQAVAYLDAVLGNSQSEHSGGCVLLIAQ